MVGRVIVRGGNSGIHSFRGCLQSTRCQKLSTFQGESIGGHRIHPRQAFHGRFGVSVKTFFIYDCFFGPLSLCIDPPLTPTHSTINTHIFVMKYIHYDTIHAWLTSGCPPSPIICIYFIQIECRVISLGLGQRGREKIHFTTLHSTGETLAIFFLRLSSEKWRDFLHNFFFGGAHKLSASHLLHFVQLSKPQVCGGIVQ